MKQKKALIGGGAVLAICCISSSCWSSWNSAKADQGRVESGATPPPAAPASTSAPAPAPTVTGATGVAVGTRARHCWPGDTYDGKTCTGVNSCKGKDGKCNGGRVIVWNGQQWQACRYLSASNYNCASTSPASVEIPGFDAANIWSP